MKIRRRVALEAGRPVGALDERREARARCPDTTAERRVMLGP
jgi:hypothetical protein